eukprot:CAMPEP_0172702240 /NCGR_PEP_ID=MMETSP1074-20121228/33736_1 /TAXON_ID=2916 /ORGANISM="Ceratium fusus, Strain PA161109" /LENGTH=56 /DNA_ID=CAMNT_0013523897 /DNA_START=61 /DNA_END=227 /DNA_ORIENTATION=-
MAVDAHACQRSEDLVVVKDVIASVPMLHYASATDYCMSNKCCMTPGAQCWRFSGET